MTNDVECSFIPNMETDFNTAREVFDVGIKNLLDLYSRYDIKSTFYFTGMMAEIVPEAVELVKSHGHEIGCHSYSHSESRYLDMLGYEEQREEIKKAKKIIESFSGKVYSFRAPSLRMNENTVKALEDCGFTSDSSICSQRFDGPFIFGSRRQLKTKWLFAHRKPYFLSYESISQKGNSNILEIPISALLFSYSGNTMRRSDITFKLLQNQLFVESKKTSKPVVFVFHPHECLNYQDRLNLVGNCSKLEYYSSLKGIKNRLKLKNLGKTSLKLLDNVLKCASDYGFDFVSASDYKDKYDRRKNGD